MRHCEYWLQDLLDDVTCGFPSRELPNPYTAFTQDARAGQFDKMDEEEFYDRKDAMHDASVMLWNEQPAALSYYVFMSYFSMLSFRTEEKEALIKLLAEAEAAECLTVFLLISCFFPRRIFSSMVSEKRKTSCITGDMFSLSCFKLRERISVSSSLIQPSVQS